MKKLIFTTALFLCSTQASALGGWLTKNATIEQIVVEDGVVKIAIDKHDNFSLPDGCDVPSTVVIVEDTKNSDRQYALLVAGMIAQKNIRMYTSGCYERWGGKFPKLYSLQVDK